MASPQGLLASIVLVGCACAPAPEVVRPDDLAASVPGASTLVVVYSRNGHTAEMGRALAKALGGDFLRLQSPGNEGGSFFTTPAWTSRLPVTPDAVDLSRYKLVLVGGPVWYWHPNAVTNSFIQSHDNDMSFTMDALKQTVNQLAGVEGRKSEEQQADEQWLRRIPDDPGGLLRRKFQYQYQQRQGGTR